jgi:hypothetical protein
LSGVAFRRRRKACEKNNHRHIVDIPRIYPPQEDYFFEYNEACPVIVIAKTEY